MSTRLAALVLIVTALAVGCGKSGGHDDDEVFALESAALASDGDFCRVVGTVFNRAREECSLAMDFSFEDSFGTIVADASDFLDNVPPKTRSAYSSTAIQSRETGDFVSCDEVSDLRLDVRLESFC